MSIKQSLGRIRIKLVIQQCTSASPSTPIDAEIHITQIYMQILNSHVVSEGDVRKIHPF